MKIGKQTSEKEQSGQEGADQQEATGMKQTQPPAQEIGGQEGAEPQASEHACLMQQCPAFKFAIQPNYNGASFSSPCSTCEGAIDSCILPLLAAVPSFDPNSSCRLSQLLDTIGLSHYAEIFIKNHVDLDMFKTLTDEDFTTLGIRSFGARKIMVNAIQGGGGFGGGSGAGAPSAPICFTISRYCPYCRTTTEFQGLAHHLSQLLEALGLSHHNEIFVENEINLDMFKTLTDEDFTTLGIRSFGARKIMLAAIQELNR
ncbi:uncharacterized protein LOC124335976 [Daphnia pulicaria]|uniref:uncharacterized protein LOC124335976 n=1 Tax=Daphnia pulicaria TaxID=35523 RepID=UPI001EEC9CD2|nr:uncharacterized protein LOC124335976 [Daphnia pulicaria]